MANLASYNITTQQNQAVLKALGSYLPPASWKQHVKAAGNTVLTSNGNATQPETLETELHYGGNLYQQNMTQLQNRYSAGKVTAHLLLLDLHVAATQDVQNLQRQQEIVQKLQSESQNTSFTHPTQGGADLSDPHLRWLLKHPFETATLFQPQMQKNPTAQQHWQQLLPQHRQQLQSLTFDNNGNHEFFKHAMATNTYNTTYRFSHHEAKSAERLSTHFTELSTRAAQLTKQTQLPMPQYVTETRGEHMAAKVLLTCLQDSGNYQLKLGFVPGGHHGIDQIWARRDSGSGAVTEYIIVEAKGSAGAQLGLPEYGEQMSPKWVFSSLMDMANVQGGGRDARLAAKILTAMFSDNFTGQGTAQNPGVWGLVLKALYDHNKPTSMHHKVIEAAGLPYYNRPDLP